MVQHLKDPQAVGRDARIGLRLTKAEKRALKLVAAFDDTSESDLLRRFTLRQIEQRAEEIGVGTSAA